MVENKNNGNNGNNELDISKSLNNSSNSNQSNQSNNSDSLNSDGFNNPNGNEDFGNDLQAQNKPINNGNSGKEGNGENKALEDGFDGNASQTAQTAKDAKTAEDNAKDAKDTAKDAASEASDAASDAAGTAGKGKVMTAFNVTDNLKASAQEAEAQDAEQSMKDVAKDTVKAAPKVASGNVPGIVADAVDYASKTLPKLVKILPVLLLCVLLIGASIFSMVGMLPSVMYGGLEEKVEERQINKAQNVIEEEYEKRISAVVSDIIKQTKNEAEIGTFSAWKRIVAGKNDNYTVTVQRKNETDAVITVKNNKTSTGLKITVNQIYLTDYSPLKADKVALINSYAYKDAYKDTKEYLSGEAVPDETLFETTSNTKWRSKDTSGLKKWLEDNMNSLVTYSVSEEPQVTEDGFTYRQLTYSVNGIFTEDDIYAAYGFSDAQKEQLKSLNFAGNMYLAACDDTSPEGTEKLSSSNIYPKLDVYTNLVGGNDNLIWSMLPSDYKHLIADNDETGTATIIREFITAAKNQVGFVAGENNNNPYSEWNNTNSAYWNAAFLSYCANTVDSVLNTGTKLLDNVIPNTGSVDYMTGFLFNNNYVWHYKNDNYVPQMGDIVVLYAPQQTINADGSITTVDTPTVAETCPELNISDTELRATALGLVETVSGGTVTFICGDTANHAVERLALDLSDYKIVAYVTPDYGSITNGTDDSLIYDGEVFDKGSFLFPVKGTVTVSALYPLYPSGTPHSGLDLACPINTPIVAANSGTVVKIDNACKTTYGKFIKIQSDTPSGTVYCIYAHLNQICVKEGDTVSAGSVIALSGNTGNTTGPHLHFGVKNSAGINVNPVPYLAKSSDIRLHATIVN